MLNTYPTMHFLWELFEKIYTYSQGIMSALTYRIYVAQHIFPNGFSLIGLFSGGFFLTLLVARIAKKVIPLF